MTEQPLIRRKLFFDNPDRAAVQLSPDGERLSWLAPLDGVLNVWIADRANPANARPVTHDRYRGVRIYFWAHTNAHIVYLQDKEGDENWRLYSVDLRNNVEKDLTPFDGVQARVLETSPKFPDELVVGLNDRDRKWHDVYRLNFLTGCLTPMFQNDRFAHVTVDDDYRLRFGTEMMPDGAVRTFTLEGGEWRLWDEVSAADALTTGRVGFDKANRRVFMRNSRGRDTAALVEVDIRTRKARLLAEDARTDVVDVIRHPTEKHVEAVGFIYDRKRWQVLDLSIEPDIAYLRTVDDGEMELGSRSLDARYWIVFYVVDDGPARYYLYDRQTRAATFLFTNRKNLEGLPLARMRSFVIKSRDGLDLVGYYTLPRGSDENNDGIPDHPLPAVFMPHGGPWWRDFWGYNALHQWLANRGYAVLCVNFRGSTGFGKRFINAGDLEWGGKMHEDQIDAVNWAISSGIADQKRVAVLGGSFGGYSALAGLTFTPEVFACAVDLVGPSNLKTLLESVPAYWKPSIAVFTTRMGNSATEEGRALLKKHSPLTYVDRICRPLLIGQGANDPRVKQAESDQIVQAMQAKKIPVTYALYPDEGHGFVRPENNMSFFAIAEVFLAKCIGGRCEPIGEDCKGSSVRVLAGAENVPGLKDALGG